MSEKTVEKVAQRVNINVPVNAELADFLSEVHWELRMSRADLCAAILGEWAKGKGFTGDIVTPKGKPGRTK